jgi:hypothetical protein
MHVVMKVKVVKTKRLIVYESFYVEKLSLFTMLSCEGIFLVVFDDVEVSILVTLQVVWQGLVCVVVLQVGWLFHFREGKGHLVRTSVSIFGCDDMGSKRSYHFTRSGVSIR